MCSSSGTSNCAPCFFLFLLVIADGRVELLSNFGYPGDPFLRCGFEGGVSPAVKGAEGKSLPEDFRRRNLGSTAEVGPLEVDSCEKDLEVRKVGRAGRTGTGDAFAFVTR